MRIFVKVIKILLVVAVIGAAAGAGWYWWLESQKEAPLSEQYPVEPVILADVAQTVLATGNVGARETVQLYMTRTETAKTVWVKEGDFIAAGDTLITWDVEQDRIELERKKEQAQLNIDNARLGLSLIGQPAQGNELVQYESDVTAAEKNVFDAENDINSTHIRITQQQRKLDDAKKTLDRNTDLLSAGAVSQAEYDYALMAYENAQEGLEDLQLQLSIKERTLELRQTQLEESNQRLSNALNKLSEQANTLKYRQQQNVILLNELELAQIDDDLTKLVDETVSPVTGYVEIVHIPEGSTASKGSLLFELADMSATIVRADVTEYDAPVLAVGQSVILTTSGLPGREYTGTITKMAAGAVEKEKSSGTERVVPVEITVTDADEVLKPGYTVDLEIFIAIRNQVLSVPLQSVATNDDRHYVYILRDEVLEKREIVTGLYGDKRVEVISGLSENEPVVLNQAEIRAKHKTE